MYRDEFHCRLIIESRPCLVFTRLDHFRQLFILFSFFVGFFLGVRWSLPVSGLQDVVCTATGRGKKKLNMLLDHLLFLFFADFNLLNFMSNLNLT